MVQKPKGSFSEEKLEVLRDGIMKWWEAEQYDFPWRCNNHEEWKLLVTEILLQRTRAGAVAELFEQFFERFPAPAALAKASVRDIKDAIYPLGLRHRAERLKKLGQRIVDLDGEVPKTREGLRQLPGVGPYVAGAFLALHRNERCAFADSNIVRLLGRYLGFDWDRETYRRAWFVELTDQFFDHNFEPSDFGYAVLDFTREVCAGSPLHGQCPLAIRERCECFRASSLG